MNRAEAITAVIVCSLMWVGVMSVVRAADPASHDGAAQSAVKPAAPDAAGVVKTKTKSNQSNDRQSTPTPGKEAVASDQPQGVVKTKTKSNQSND